MKAERKFLDELTLCAIIIEIHSRIDVSCYSAKTILNIKCTEYIVKNVDENSGDPASS